MRKVLLILVFIILISLCFVFGLQDYLNVSFLKDRKDLLLGYVHADFGLSSSIFFLVYLILTAISFPGASILTLLAGALFGLAYGTVLVSFASTIGATISFLFARYILRDIIYQRFGKKMRDLEEGFAKDGIYYLFSLRLIPIFPFFVVNLVMGLLPIRVSQYYIASQIGMLPGTIVYVNAGTELSKISVLSDIMSLRLWLAFALLGILPLASKFLVSVIRKKFKRFS